MEFYIQLILLALVAIVFLQSGFDKVVDWNGNLSWLKSHFSKTLLKSSVPLALAIITLLEIVAGLTAIVGMGEILLYSATCFAFWSAILSAITLLLLFLGQRLAKDYAGAQTLVIYLIPVLILLYTLGD